MKIRFLECTSAVARSRPGVVFDINDVLANHLISLKQAEPFEDSIETAARAAPETAAVRPRRKRGAVPAASLI